MMITARPLPPEELSRSGGGASNPRHHAVPGSAASLWTSARYLAMPSRSTSDLLPLPGSFCVIPG
jgi:hypothetical protein